MIPDPETAPIVKSIFQMVLDGMSTSETATRLNDQGILTPLQYKQHKVKAVCQNRELLWSHIMVLNILHNYKYTGAMVNHIRENRHLRDKNQRRTAPEEWIVTENAHEPLISKADFERANAMLRHPQKVQHHPKGSSDAVFYCGHCGRKLRKTFGSDVYFSCDTPSYQTEAACRGLRWSKSELEKVLFPVYRIQLELLGEKAVGLLKETQSDQSFFLVRRMGQIERELQSIDRQKMQLFEDYHDRKLDLTAYMEQKTALAQRRERLRENQSEMEADYRRYREYQEQCKAKTARLSAYLSATQVPDEQLRSKMYEAIDRVNVLEKSIEVRWKFEDVFSSKDIAKQEAG